GIAYGGGAIFVADTYNSKIKKIDPKTGTTKTFAGGSDRKAIFEPAGLVVRNDELVVADTDHHRVVSFKIAGAAEKEIALAGLTAPTHGVSVAAATERARAKPEERIAIGDAVPKSGSVHVEWKVPAGTGINDDAPFRAHFLEATGTAMPSDVKGTGKDVKNGFDVAVAPTGADPAHVRADVDVVICDIATHRVCVPIRREIAFDVHASGAQSPTLALPLPAAR
ncbi:MAG TPA: hypothetical protein VF407_03740, partial [Polyangiaceae bacterium]